ncbi:MAG TPA: VTT domain-containing protein [bacterium]|nr:VTT domain-containing protein [bacterium]
MAGNLDQYLVDILRDFGNWTYLLLFALAFAETILVLTPFLPGYSMLFAAGAIAGRPEAPLNVILLLFGFIVAGSLGDSVNYMVGRKAGPRLMKIIRSAKMKARVERTENFFDQHSRKTIILARFVPVVRSLAPLVAGFRCMSFRRFLGLNLIGGALCVGLYLFGGYFFGSVPAVRANFWLVLISIVIVSILPGLIEIIRFRYHPAPHPPQPPK